MNWKIRIKNPWFWIGLLSVILTAVGVDPQSLTSWQAVWNGIISTLNNPVQLGAVVVAVLGVFIDPTTSGLTDSDRAMEYDKPLEK